MLIPFGLKGDALIRTWFSYFVLTMFVEIVFTYRKSKLLKLYFTKSICKDGGWHVFNYPARGEEAASRILALIEKDFKNQL